MKIHIKIVGTLLLLLTLNSPLSTARALTAAFTYQGRLNNSNAPANGSYDIAFTLYATNATGSAVAGPILNTNVIVTNGLFTTAVDFGSGVFTGTNYWLELAVSTNGANAFSTLAPRQALTPTPYATFAAGANAAGLSGTISTTNLGGTYGNPVNFSNGQNNFDGTFSGLFFGTSFVGGSFVGNGSALMGVWHTMGDFGTTPIQNYLGTADNQPLIIKVNGQQAFEFLPAPTPNIIGGSAFNSLNAGLAYGITISGGGEAAFPNRVQATYNATYATIAGGADNIISGSNSMHSVIGGGSFNSIVATGEVVQSTIAGGTLNNIQSADSTIGGGQGNTIGTNSTWATISGGLDNWIHEYAGGSFIGGGYANVIQSDLKAETNDGVVNSAIAGGSFNQIQTDSAWSFIGSGYGNVVQPFAREAVIGGGAFNSIQGSSNRWFFNAIGAQTIAGGNNNAIQAESYYATIGGGAVNVIGTNSPYSTIAGGLNNVIQTNSALASIGGGDNNTIQSNDFGAVISGGLNNQIQIYADYSFIGGGFGNIIAGDSNYWAVGFGIANMIGGGANNQIQPNSSYTTIAGGVLNIVSSNSGWASIGGGAINRIGSNSTYATIAGGEYNNILSNTVNATIGGGMSNLVGGTGGTVPGGTANLAGGFDSFAAGTQAQSTNDGSFVLTDDIATNFYSTTSNQLSARFTGGVRIVTGGAGMTVDGQSVVAGNNVNAATLGGIPSTGFWKTTGNAGTTPGANFIGTTDGAYLQLKAPFVGVGRTTPITGSDVFSMDAPAGPGGFGGMYINTPNTSADPFYGYALGGFYAAYHYVDGSDTNKWKLVTGGSGGFGGTVRLTVMATGNVGIGTTTPDSLLTVNGTADKPGGGSWNTLSDARLKDIGTNFTHGLESLENIQPVNYHYKKDNPMNLPSQPEYVGVIAQQVQAAIPEAVHPNGSGYLTVNNDPIIWTMVNAIKELNHKVDEKDAENAELKQQLASLEAQVHQLARERGK
jgi:hypothetical protein